MRPEIVVYTAALGLQTDPLRSLCAVPRAKLDDVVFVCFTDQPATREAVLKQPRHGPQWSLVWLEKKDLDPRLESRKLKILSHLLFPGVPYTLWLDAAFQLLAHPQRILAHMGNADFMAFRHPRRNRITEEARAIVDLGLVSEEQVFAQLSAYKREGFDTDENPQQFITSTGLLCRRMSPRVAEFERRWFCEVACRGYRDQMSIDFVLWQMAREGKPLSVCYLPGHYRENAYAKWYPDRNSKVVRRDSPLRCHPNVQPPGGVRSVGAVDGASNAPA